MPPDRGTTSSSAETAMMLRLAARDETALRELYDLHASRLLGLLVALLRDRPQAEEVLQQVFLQVWRTARHYDPMRGAPLAWITQIARSRALDSLRRRRPEPLLTRAADASEVAAAEMDHVAERLDISDALSELSGGERRLVELCYLGGYSHREVAQASGLPLGTVKSTIRRALSKLRSSLQEEDGHARTGTPAR